jgi:predicted Zn-ribbon and HTH transcriptional regulator
MRTLVEIKKCLRCGHMWQPRVKDPKKCSHCGSPYWATPRRNNGTRNAEGSHFGYDSYCAEPNEEFTFDNYRFTDNDESIYNHTRCCPECDQHKTDKGHDPCLKNLPGVKSACCGHGREQGYIQFTNGIVVRGIFEAAR